MIRIVVHGDNAELSPNRMSGKHWTVRKRLTSKAHQRAFAAWIEAGRPVWGDGIATVQPIIRRGRVMDRDNALASLKAVIDGLFKGRVTVDDSMAHIDLLMPVQETGKQWIGREQVEFWIFRKIAWHTFAYTLSY